MASKLFKMIGMVGLLLLVPGCVQNTQPQSIDEGESLKVDEPVETSELVEKKIKGPYDEFSKDVLEAGLAYTQNDTGHVLISKASLDKEYRTTYMIISKEGKVIMSDPYNVIPGIKADIITSSHHDYDHRDGKFNAYNPESKIVNWQMESFVEKEIGVTAIASTHYDYKIDLKRPSNIIYLYEVDGLRIAAMGDICQQAFTEEQLSALGHIDVVFIMMEDASDYGFSAENTINMLKQLKPTIAMPTHQSISVLDEVATLFDERIDADYFYEITEESLSDGKTKLVILADIEQ